MVPRRQIYILSVYVTRFSSSNAPPTLTGRQIRANDNRMIQNTFICGKIAHFSSTYENVNKTDNLQPFGCSQPLIFKNLVF